MAHPRERWCLLRHRAVDLFSTDDLLAEYPNWILFLLRHYDLNQLLEPRSITADPLDYRLSWHLWEVLRALNYTHLSEQCEGVLQASYAGQLESEGLWEWAIFVFLHIENSGWVKSLWTLWRNAILKCIASFHTALLTIQRLVWISKISLSARGWVNKQLAGSKEEPPVAGVFKWRVHWVVWKTLAKGTVAPCGFSCCLRGSCYRQKRHITTEPSEYI